MAHQVTPFPIAKVTGEPAAMVTRHSRVIVVLGNQRYALDFTAEARPLPPQRASVTPLGTPPLKSAAWIIAAKMFPRSVPMYLRGRN
jgi:hypothetical protein